MAVYVVAGLLGLTISAYSQPNLFQTQLEALEEKSGGSLHACLVDVNTGRTWAFQGDSPSLMCSTFKALAVAAVLSRVDHGEDSLDRKVHFGRRDLLSYAPTTSRFVGQGWMTLQALCEAAVTESDNTAANLILASIGGPRGFTHFCRRIGDPFSRLDRNEPGLNATSTMAFNCTTAVWMARDLKNVIFGDVLSPEGRELLKAWMLRCQTGRTSIRAGVPSSWKIGDKTGSGGTRLGEGDYSQLNDIAFALPTDHGPVVITGYLSTSKLHGGARQAILADLGRIAAMVIYNSGS